MTVTITHVDAKASDRHSHRHNDGGECDRWPNKRTDRERHDHHAIRSFFAPRWLSWAVSPMLVMSSSPIHSMAGAAPRIDRTGGQTVMSSWWPRLSLGHGEA
jgi:hypothetical protein